LVCRAYEQLPLNAGRSSDGFLPRLGHLLNGKDVVGGKEREDVLEELGRFGDAVTCRLWALCRVHVRHGTRYEWGCEIGCDSCRGLGQVSGAGMSHVVLVSRWAGLFSIGGSHLG
jgi:hypothetical protein